MPRLRHACSLCVQSSGGEVSVASRCHPCPAGRVSCAECCLHGQGSAWLLRVHQHPCVVAFPRGPARPSPASLRAALGEGPGPLWAGASPALGRGPMRTSHAKAGLGTGFELRCYLWISSVPLRSERLGIWPYSVGWPKSVASFIQKRLPGRPRRCDGRCRGRGHGPCVQVAPRGPPARSPHVGAVPQGEDSASCWHRPWAPGVRSVRPGARSLGSTGQAPASFPTGAGLGGWPESQGSWGKEAPPFSEVTGGPGGPELALPSGFSQRPGVALTAAWEPGARAPRAPPGEPLRPQPCGGDQSLQSQLQG